MNQDPGAFAQWIIQKLSTGNMQYVYALVIFCAALAAITNFHHFSWNWFFYIVVVIGFIEAVGYFTNGMPIG